LRKFGIRLFTLAVCTAALLTVPMVQPSKAAGNGGGEVEKTRKKTQASASGDLQSPTQSGDLRSPTLRIWPPPMQDDVDRKAGGGGGM